MLEGKPADYATQFQSRPHTGMVYTPPKYSDHIGVSWLLSTPVAAASRALSSREKSRTLKAQPHKQQPTIKDMFAARPKKKAKIDPAGAAAGAATGSGGSSITGGVAVKTRPPGLAAGVAGLFGGAKKAGSGGGGGGGGVGGISARPAGAKPCGTCWKYKCSCKAKKKKQGGKGKARRR